MMKEGIGHELMGPQSQHEQWMWSTSRRNAQTILWVRETHFQKATINLPIGYPDSSSSDDLTSDY